MMRAKFDDVGGKCSLERERIKEKKVASRQWDQIGRNFAICATLGYFLLNQFLTKQAISTHGLL